MNGKKRIFFTICILSLSHIHAFASVPGVPPFNCLTESGSNKFVTCPTQNSSNQPLSYMQSCFNCCFYQDSISQNYHLVCMCSLSNSTGVTQQCLASDLNVGQCQSDSYTGSSFTDIGNNNGNLQCNYQNSKNQPAVYTSVSVMPLHAVDCENATGGPNPAPNICPSPSSVQSKQDGSKH